VNVHSQQEGGGLLRGQLRDVFLENQPPTANAGPDQTLTLEVGQTAVDVTLDGSGSSDPDGTIAAYIWTGTPDPDDVDMPTVSLGVGVHTFTLVVTDNEAADSAPDTVVITVQEQAPLDGAQLYADNCSTCHGTDASGTTIAGNIQGASDETIQDAINTVPAMASLSFLTPEEVEAIAGFLAQQAPLVSFANDIQPIFTANCAKVGCHVGTSPQAGLNLEAGQAYSNLVNVLSSEMPSLARVEPGDPDNSYLYLKHSGAAGIVGSRMPLDNPNFFVNNPDLLDLEEEWIRQGALNN
jgi:cytochrome c5